MAAAQKFVAVFLVCMFVLSATNVPQAEAASQIYRACFDECLTACMKSGKGYTNCEMKCDTECTAREFKAKLEGQLKVRSTKH